jgi:hypothetical protein
VNSNAIRHEVAPHEDHVAVAETQVGRLTCEIALFIEARHRELDIGILGRRIFHDDVVESSRAQRIDEEIQVIEFDGSGVRHIGIRFTVRVRDDQEVGRRLAADQRYLLQPDDVRPFALHDVRNRLCPLGEVGRLKSRNTLAPTYRFWVITSIFATSAGPLPGPACASSAKGTSRPAMIM